MLEKKIEDFFDARFGLFIHWGLYSQLAGEWQGEKMNDIAEWIMSYHKIPIKSYEQLAKSFDPKAFDAEAIVKLAKNAGMRYLVITSKHHEGFALFKSDADPYNVVDATSCGRDIIAELSVACKKYDMKFGLYYSQSLDWHERNAGGWDDPRYLPERRPWGNIWDFPDPTGKDFEEYFSRKVLPQVKELLTNYGDIFLLWFDTPRTISVDQSTRLYEMVKSLQPNCLVNSRIGNGQGDYISLGDNQLPTMPLSIPSESPVTLNDTWGYKYYDDNWKDSNDIIDKLVRLSAKNVNFLLNIGPCGDGSIPEETTKILNKVGEWVTKNKEALDETRGNPYHHDFKWGSVTTKDNNMYLFINDNNKESLDIRGLITKVISIKSLEDKKDVEFTQSLDKNSLSLNIKLLPSDNYRPVYKIECCCTPEFSEEIMAQDKGIIALYPHLACMEKDNVRQLLPQYGFGDRYIKHGEMAINNAGELVNWNDEDITLVWDVNINAIGSYEVEITTPTFYNKEPVWADSKIELIIKDNELKQETSVIWDGIYISGTTKGRMLEIKTTGQKTIILKAHTDCVGLQSVTLIYKGDN